MAEKNTEQLGAINQRIPIPDTGVYLTEAQIAELANIGSQYLYLYAMDEGRLSYGGVLKILERYEEFRKTESQY